GRQTVLAARRPFSSPLAADARRGACRVELAETAGFAPGDAVVISSLSQRGWKSTHAIVQTVDGTTLHLSRPLWNDYKVADKAAAVHWFAMISAVLEHDVSIADLAIEGVPERIWLRPDFTASAIHLVRCCDSQVSGCQVRGWPHDGVSVQMGGRVGVNNCRVQRCCGHGFHPGTGTRQTVWSNNIAADNGMDGLFFCMRVRDSIVSNNLFVGNRRHGVGGLGGGEDWRNLVANNQCVRNGGAGIELDGGKSNTVIGNICRANSQAGRGKWPGILLTKTRLNIVRANQCFDEANSATQTIGIEERPDAGENIVAQNVCLACELSLAGQASIWVENIAHATAQP
ncbi:MAG: right-handed parallel beta-helix repeat-containing protein, partial [Phycisphaerae bacterium]